MSFGARLLIDWVIVSIGLGLALGRLIAWGSRDEESGENGGNIE